jgi:hypothetical protein
VVVSIDMEFVVMISMMSSAAMMMLPTGMGKKE